MKGEFPVSLEAVEKFIEKLRLKITFKINFRDIIYTVSLSPNEFDCQVNTSQPQALLLNGTKKEVVEQLTIEL